MQETGPGVSCESVWEPGRRWHRPASGVRAGYPWSLELAREDEVDTLSLPRSLAPDYTVRARDAILFNPFIAWSTTLMARPHPNRAPKPTRGECPHCHRQRPDAVARALTPLCFDPRRRHCPRTPTAFARLILLNGPCRDIVFFVTTSELTIGAYRGNHLRIDDAGLARHHARLTFTPPEHFQLIAADGHTFWHQGTALHDRVLAHGDILHLGDISLRFESLIPAVENDAHAGDPHYQRLIQLTRTGDPDAALALLAEARRRGDHARVTLAQQGLLHAAPVSPSPPE